MRITLCSSGRFHLADLARELVGLGQDVRFHSLVPPNRLRVFDLPEPAQTCHLAFLWPWIVPMAAARIGIKVSRRWSDRFDHQMLKRLDGRFSRINNPGQFFIGMSGLCVDSLTAARGRGAIVLLERGSRHILSQKEILDAGGPNGRSLIQDWAVERELQGYECADVIVVPSRHVEQSFVDQGVQRSKLFRNPYGVNLDAFGPTALIEPAWDVMMVGLWSREKGCDTLARVVLEEMGLSLLHVGAVGELALPNHENFHHEPAVLQSHLPEQYAKARVFVMPSLQDGFGMVYSQALACGLPVIGSTRSGVPDLIELTGLGVPELQAVDPGQPEKLKVAILEALNLAHSQTAGTPRKLLGQAGEGLTWAAYGRRYLEFLNNLLN